MNKRLKTWMTKMGELFGLDPRVTSIDMEGVEMHKVMDPMEKEEENDGPVASMAEIGVDNIDLKAPGEEDEDETGQDTHLGAEEAKMDVIAKENEGIKE